eukprot:6184331-Pleurochrysis_carterae.AAC.3
MVIDRRYQLPIVEERAQVSGLSAPTGGPGSGALADGGGHAQARSPELGERSASAPQVRMRCECNWGDCA